MHGQFEVYEDTTGRYRWRLVASNGETVADDPATYGAPTADGARRAVRAARAGMGLDPHTGETPGRPEVVEVAA